MIRRGTVFMLVFTLLSGLFLLSPVGYSYSERTDLEFVTMVEGLSIYRYEDGRIKGVTKQELSENKQFSLKWVLLQMR